MKLARLFSIFAIASLALFISCTKDQQNNTLPTLKFTPDVKDVEFEATGGMKEIQFDANRDWSIKVTPNSSWLNVSLTSGSAAKGVKVTIRADKTTEGRTATVEFYLGKLKQREITVKQKAGTSQGGDQGGKTPPATDSTPLDKFIAGTETKFSGNVKIIAVNGYGAVVNDGGAKNIFVSTYDSKKEVREERAKFLKENKEKVINLQADRQTDKYANGMIQLNNPVWSVAEGATIDVKPVEATVLDKDKLDEFTSNTPVLIKVTGTYMVVKRENKTYYNFKVGGKKELSLIYVDGIKMENGKKYTIEGYFLGLKGKKYIVFGTTKIVSQD